MKTVLSSDYKYKKIIADNLQDILERRYIEKYLMPNMKE